MLKGKSSKSALIQITPKQNRNLFLKGMFLMELLEGEREIIVEHVDAILKNYRNDRENLIPILQEVQGRLGYLPGLAMEKIAKAINIPAVDVFGLATFYNQFRLNPPGKHQIKVCMGTACYMVGGQIALDSFERRLNIKEGETTCDRNFSLERVACVGCCSIAPVVVVDDIIEGKVTPTRVDGIMLSFETDSQKKKNEKEKCEEEGNQLWVQFLQKDAMKN
jgi:NADH-quinone oxidoreductase subunit E